MKRSSETWRTPQLYEVKMDAEIGSYQEDYLLIDRTMRIDKSGERRPRRLGGSLRSGAAALSAGIALGAAHNAAAATKFPIWTEKVTQLRTGWNGLETDLTLSALSSPSSTFGRKTTWFLPAGTGQIEGQLLYSPQVLVTPCSGSCSGITTNISAPNTYDLLIASTTKDWVVVYDANDPTIASGGSATPLFTINLNLADPAYAPQGTAPACNSHNGGGVIQRYSGVTSTGHISGNPFNSDVTLYLVDKAVPKNTNPPDCATSNVDDISAPGTFFRVWEIDLNSGGANVTPPASLTGNMVFWDGLAFDPRVQAQRPGLLTWANNYIYVGFAGMPADTDGPTPTSGYNGWLMQFSTTLSSGLPLTVWASTSTHSTEQGPMFNSGGIWQGGNGIAVNPAQNNIVVATGNEIVKNANGSTDFGDSLVSLPLNAPLTGVVHSYIPDDCSIEGNCSGKPKGGLTSASYDNADFDFSSAGPISTAFNTMVHAGKDGVMRGFDGNLNRLDGPFHATFPQYNDGSSQNPRCLPRLAKAGGDADELWSRFYGGPAYMNDVNGNGWVLVWGSKDYLRSYPYTSFLGLAFFNQVHFVSSLDPADEQITYCDDKNCSSNCVVGSNFSPPLTNPPAQTPPDDFHIADNLRSNVMAPDGTSGGILAISGTPPNAVVFASINSPVKQNAAGHKQSEFDLQYGILYAFDAELNSPTPIWSNASDAPYVFAHFVSPTVTNGRVYLPEWQFAGVGQFGPKSNGDSQISIYGL